MGAGDGGGGDIGGYYKYGLTGMTWCLLMREFRGKLSHREHFVSGEGWMGEGDEGYSKKGYNLDNTLRISLAPPPTQLSFF